MENTEIEEINGQPVADKPATSNFKNSATILIAVGLINIVVYLKLLTEMLLYKHFEPSLLFSFLLMAAIILELLGLGSLLCKRESLLLFLYSLAALLALGTSSLIYLLQHHLPAVVSLIGNCLCLWRFVYVLRRRLKKKGSTGWQNSTRMVHRI